MKSGNIKISQVSLELILGLIVMVLLFGASVRLFVWLCNSLIGRQSAFEDSREISGAAEVSPEDIQELNYEPPPINLLGVRD